MMYLYVHTYLQTCICTHTTHDGAYGVASASRIDEIVGLFCKRALSKRRYSAKETYNLIDPADCSHPIVNVQSIACGVS